MTLYYSLVFLLLMAEMVLFMLLIVPMPYSLKRKMFTFLSESPLIARLQYGLKITFIFILILFVDSVNRVYRVQMEVSSFTHGNERASVVGTERLEVQARKFYSQRNMYLCGFTLFLSLILNRTYIFILDILRLEDEVKRMKGDPDALKSKDSERLDNAAGAGDIGRLKKELSKKDRDIEALKKQMEGLSREYNRMGDQVSPQDEAPKKDR
ncbi:B-cell receptor-associated 31-like protein [Eremomyces bilateralis CBS 781.70]|uniref:Endoplasmic reticulum transmembrane protein n=1 Tax=Eremomyces bilateralis CBS 781.70 TaxID=1392243 RepID=A0A6G1G7P1_9PEZI|nr:B-cell receptor-associated 31-like protein [Eremomyces bilateralis CBS 781.70]KAF1814078.1 B-cell receptor-associated 31-like protein [Eremomyces bilateralis CBS 781.70]